MRTLLALAVALCLAVGCATGTVAESACDSQSVSVPFPSIPSLPHLPSGAVEIPELAAPPFNEDLSSTLDKVSKVADSLSLTIQSLTVDNTNHDFDWISNVDAYITGSGTNQPRTLLASYQMDGVSSVLSVSEVLDPNTLLLYLEAGSVQFDLVFGAATVSAADAKKLEGLGSSLTTTVNLCVLANGSVSKSL
jgi:hypothetical protein